MILNHTEIAELLDAGVVEGGQYSAINGASLDVHLGPLILQEAKGGGVVDYRKRERLLMREIDATNGFTLYPGEFILAQTVEKFHFPNDVSAEYKLKSSMARIGLEHLNSGFCDCGWHNSVLTLEFKNMTQYHAIKIQAGDPIGQMLFFRHTPALESHSYATKGRYNNLNTVEQIK